MKSISRIFLKIREIYNKYLIFFLFQAMQQQKFREQQETERRKRLDEHRARDHDKYVQVEERRKAIENAERERRTALLKKNQDREDKIIGKKNILKFP